MKVKTYKDLDVWRKGIDIVDRIYALTKKFSSEEKYVLVTQMQRAAISIPSNVAEGFVRQHSKEYAQFLYVALGSCAELETQIVISNRRNYLTEVELKELEECLDHESRMLMNLIKALR